MAFIDKILGDYSKKEVKRVSKIADKILLLEKKVEQLNDGELKSKTIEFKNRLKDGESLDDILVEAFAVLREASFRVFKMKHYKVQLIGGVVLHQGRIAEMKTGEGKTLVATLPVYLNALTGKGVHVITVNDYLAKRDRDEMGKLYEFLGLTSGVVIQSMNEDERRAAYKCDITYGTNSEFGFDYLRDNMVVTKEKKVQRELNYCVIDEVDSILIDEARTPLIISGAGKSISELYSISDYFAKSLKEEEDYTVDYEAKAVLLTEKGIEKAETYYKIENYADIKNFDIQHHTFQALKANYVMKREIDYIVKEGKVFIVDEFTGRVMDGRRFSDGLHEAIEAKENLKIEGQSNTMATITYQNFFRMYEKLSGMTGTGYSEDQEFRDIYGIDVVVVPTNKPIARIDREDIIYKTEFEKFNAVLQEIEKTYITGQPVLVGTSSVEKSETLSFMLKRKGIKHQILNAKNHAKEAEIVAKAGEKYSVTIATNMAGRGTDIKLGCGVQELGGLKVIGTERHESVRIDNQLRGRSGRQGDVGESVFFLSLEDELIKIHASDRLKEQIKKFDIKMGEPIKEDFARKAIITSQSNLEGNNFEGRKNLIKFDDVTNEQRKIIYKQRNEILDGIDVNEQLILIANEIIEFDVQNYLEQYEREDYNEDIIKKMIKHFKKIYRMDSIKESDLKDLNDEEITKYFKDNYYNCIQKKKKILGNNFNDFIKNIMLKVLDKNWIDHIERMENLKQYIVLKAYQQQNPVYAYQMEGGEIFKETINNIKLEITEYSLIDTD